MQILFLFQRTKNLPANNKIHEMKTGCIPEGKGCRNWKAREMELWVEGCRKDEKSSHQKSVRRRAKVRLDLQRTSQTKIDGSPCMFRSSMAAPQPAGSKRTGNGGFCERTKGCERKRRGKNGNRRSCLVKGILVNLLCSREKKPKQQKNEGHFRHYTVLSYSV